MLKIKPLLRSYYASTKSKSGSGSHYKLRLNVPSFSWEEVWEVLDSLLSANVTMGKKVSRFEEAFAEYLGVENAIMVNSGSSANLIALSVLANIEEGRIEPGDEIITPATTWPTTVFSIASVGAVPVLVDVDLETYNISIDSIKKTIGPRTKGILPINLLGNPCDMPNILEFKEKHDLFVVEDACDALGAQHGGKKMGSFGDLGTFSFFFSHHISTIEGGMVVTDDDNFADLARSMRAHGWIRERKDREKVASEHQSLDSRFLFVTPGYNVRPTELQGAFGIHQIRRLEKFISARRSNARRWTERLRRFSDYLLLQEEREGTRHVWLGYPLTIKPGAPFKRVNFMNFLESKGIETRPLLAGNIVEQPAVKHLKYRIAGGLSNARIAMQNSFFWGNNHAVDRETVEYVADCAAEFMERKGA